MNSVLFVYRLVSQLLFSTSHFARPRDGRGEREQSSSLSERDEMPGKQLRRSGLGALTQVENGHWMWLRSGDR